MKPTAPRTWRPWLAGALASLLLALMAGSPGRALPDEGGPDRLALLRMLRAGDYARLEAHLTHLQTAYEDGAGSDAVVAYAFETFASADPDLEPQFEGWLSRYPRSYAARAARALYFRHLGRITLAGPEQSTAEEVNGAQASGYSARATADLEAALERHPQLGVAHAILIDLAAAAGDPQAADRAMGAGLQADPGSFTIRRSYLLALQPWRRPHAEPEQLLAALEVFVDRIAEDSVGLPALRPLTGFGAFVTAELLRRQRRHQQAESYYAEALAAGADRAYLQQQAINAFRQGRFADALKGFDRALVLWPQSAELLDRRARTRRALGDLEMAHADWKLALALDPWNPNILLVQAAAFRNMERPQEAAAALDRAVRYGAHDPRVWEARGRLLLHALDRPKAAAADLRRATELDPHAAEAWRGYAEALLRTKQCDTAAGALTRYQRLCANGVRCAPENVHWAETALLGTRDPGDCPVYGILGP
jgi:tetratricopeptide (TPR) repeat protein